MLLRCRFLWCTTNTARESWRLPMPVTPTMRTKSEPMSPREPRTPYNLNWGREPGKVSRWDRSEFLVCDAPCAIEIVDAHVSVSQPCSPSPVMNPLQGSRTIAQRPPLQCRSVKQEDTWPIRPLCPPFSRLSNREPPEPASEQPKTSLLACLALSSRDG